ncbi:uncharacterized protein BCR38DRAFT_426810 [Pseudomassariella vexata]|uniref:Magnesium transporter n=1 Tax=Pseudomassariella vexata TaxID=1141098 RepID=A0A1Y2E751_9PEZI|nr:uncharacterized protein BCR38DRAFT_426810 [Pseudomassariella vexata]ORY67359.1 hypothetical protein BCR38DRAFT_426810 [Pseudomassariella vexata]
MLRRPSMASAHFPVPSLRLLRFLRCQSENFSFSFFNPSHGGTTRKILNLSRKASRALSKDCTVSKTRHDYHLQAGLLDLGLLSPNRTPCALKNARSKRPAFFTTTVAPRHSSIASNAPPSCKQTLGDQGTWPKATELKPDDLPEPNADGENNSMFNTHRQLSRQAALEPRLRCTEVDENGAAIVVDGEFKKSELIARFGLLPRDLRKIDSSNLPHILVRPQSILLNLLHLRVLIKYNRVLLFDVYGSKSSYPQSAFMYDLQHKLQQRTSPGNGGLPYEFRALEAVLQSVTQELESDFEAVRDPVIRLLSELEDDIDRHGLRFLLILSKKLSTFEQKARLVRNALDDVLEADDDLAMMYLTEKTHDIYREVDDHTEVEMLLESYHKLCDEIVEEAGNLVSSIRNTEEIARAILDANRNSLMLLDLKFSVGTLGLAMGTFIAGLYGMNLENFIEETNWGFSAVTGVSVILSLWVCAYGLKKLRRVQVMKMQGDERGSLKKVSGYHWFHDEGHGAMLDPRNREKLRRLQIKKASNADKKKWWQVFEGR